MHSWRGTPLAHSPAAACLPACRRLPLPCAAAAWVQMATFQDLPLDVQAYIFYLVPHSRQHVHSLRLVCKAWAMVPLCRAAARTPEACRLLLSCIQGPEAWRRQRSRPPSVPLLRFQHLLSLEVCACTALAPSWLWRTLTSSTTCGFSLQSITLGHLAAPAGQRMLNTLAQASPALPNLQRLCIGSTTYDLHNDLETLQFCWPSHPHYLQQLHTLEVRSRPGRHIQPVLLRHPLPKLQHLILVDTQLLTIRLDSLPPSAQLTCKVTRPNNSTLTERHPASLCVDQTAAAAHELCTVCFRLYAQLHKQWKVLCIRSPCWAGTLATLMDACV